MTPPHTHCPVLLETGRSIPQHRMKLSGPYSLLPSSPPPPTRSSPSPFFPSPPSHFLLPFSPSPTPPPPPFLPQGQQMSDPSKQLIRKWSLPYVKSKVINHFTSCPIRLVRLHHEPKVSSAAVLHGGVPGTRQSGTKVLT